MSAVRALRHLLVCGLLLPGPALAGPPFQVEDSETPGRGALRLFPAVMGQRTGEGGHFEQASFSALYGLGAHTELSLSIAHAHRREVQQTPAVGGFTDIGVGLKQELSNLDLDGFGAALAYATTLPTGDESHGLSSGRPDHAGYLIVEREIGPAILSVNLGGIHTGAVNTRLAFAYGVLVTAPVSKRWTLGVQCFGNSHAASGEEPRRLVGAGLQFHAGPRLSLLIAANHGVSGDARSDAYAGLQVDLSRADLEY